MKIKHTIWALPILLAFVVGFMLLGKALATDKGAWFESLRQPGTNFGCCDISDCAKVDAEVRDGAWWAKIGETWRQVPDNVILAKPVSIDGNAYACTGSYSFMAAGQTDGPPFFYCFVPPWSLF